MAVGIISAVEHHHPYHDIESIFWVITYCALRWLPHSYVKPKELSELIWKLFYSGDAGAKALEFHLSSHLAQVTTWPEAFQTWFADFKDLVIDVLTVRKNKRRSLDELNLDHLRKLWTNATRAAITGLGDHACDRVSHDIADERQACVIHPTISTSWPSESLHSGVKLEVDEVNIQGELPPSSRSGSVGEQYLGLSGDRPAKRSRVI
jgi:hypothetical protein